MRIDAIYESPISLCFLLQYCCYNSTPVRARSAAVSFSASFATKHAYNESYYIVRPKLESINIWNLSLVIKKY